MGHIGEKNGFGLICPFRLFQGCLQPLFADLFFGQDLPVLFIYNMLSSGKMDGTEEQQQDDGHKDRGNDKIAERARSGFQHMSGYGDKQIPGTAAHRHIHQIAPPAHPGKNQGTGFTGSHILFQLDVRFHSSLVRKRQAVQKIVCYHHVVFIMGFEKDISLLVNDRGIALLCVYIQCQKIFQFIKSRCYKNTGYLRGGIHAFFKLNII